MIRTSLLCGALLCSAVTTNAADFRPIKKDEMIEIVTGHTVVGEYRRYRDRTETFSFRETHHADGTTDYVEGGIEAKGTWYFLTDAKGCFKYDQADFIGTTCYWTYHSKGCYYDYTINEMTPTGPRDFDNWSSRWIIEGSGNTCAVPLS